MDTLTESCKIEHIQLVSELEQRMAFVTVTIGPVKIHGLTVWRARNGHLSVLWPRYRGVLYGWNDVIEIEPELRASIEAQVIAAYKDARTRAKAVAA